MIEILHMQHAKEEPVSITALFFIFKQKIHFSTCQTKSERKSIRGVIFIELLSKEC